MSTYAIYISIAVFLLLMFLKVPVFVSILSGTILYFFMIPSVPTLIISQRITAGIQSVPLLAVPLFVLAGVMMNYSGVTSRIMSFCEVVTGRMWGGLAQVNVLLSTLMGGLSGSSLADAAMEAKMLVPEMNKRGFSNEFSTVVTAVSSMITPLIPPGLGMIMLGSIGSISVGKLFISGLGIGAFLCLALMVLVSLISKDRGYQPMRNKKLSKVEVWTSTKKAIIPLCLPVIIIGGIRIGVFTATEAGSVAIVYAMILGFAYKELTLKKIIAAIKESVISTAAILLIVGASSAFSWILTREKIPQTLTAMMLSFTTNKYIFLLILNIFLILVGMFIEGNAALIVLIPLLLPISRAFGIDDIQFAMIYLFNMSIGAITPPMGTLMFVTCGITNCPIKSFMKESLPFYIVLLICLLAISYIPILSTGLVSLLY